MDVENFRRHGHELINWVADYLADAGRYPVLAQVQPGEIRSRLPDAAPVEGEPMERILADFRAIILPGVTHWNHPRFFAYFPANNSGPSILGELLSAGLGINAMMWQTCPAATELEEQVMEWLRQMIGLPASFRGVIQDTASTATICALICAREKTTGFAVNEHGFAAAGSAAGGALRVYTSRESHSSVEKGARVAGFGRQNVVTVAVSGNYALDPADLERCIRADLERGLRPCCAVATVGTTSSTAVDPVGAMADICARHGLWLHVDAALAGNAAILPEKRWLLDGCDRCDSLVFNPHKWLLTNFDCSAFFTRDPDTLVKALTILPEYLRTDRDRVVTNFRDWGLPLGRRFRALKLWFVLRSYGVQGLQELLRRHIALAEEFRGWVEESEHFELMAPVTVNTVCFRLRPRKSSAQDLDEQKLAEINKALLDEVNATGRIYMTHTKLNGSFTLRLCVGQGSTQREHVAEAWECLQNAEVTRKWC